MDKSALLVVSCVAFAVFNNNQVAACCWCRRLTANFPTEEDNLNSTVGRRLQYINKNSLLKEKQKGQYAVHYRTCALTRTQCAGKPLSTCNFNCPGDLDLSQSGVTGAIPKSICSAKGLTGLRISSTDDLYAPSHQTGSSSTLLHRHPCQFKVPTPLTPLGSNACTPGHKCQACQGDCDKDSDCATGLKCFQRNDRTPVPGCRNGMSGDKPGWDYCYKKEEKVKRPTTNHISGGLPQCVGDLVNLETLDLSVGFHKPTGISGSIPKSICKLKKLTRLDLAHTKVSGSLPECMGSLKIKVLDLQGTLISGPVPTLWCHHASQFSFIFLPKTMCLPKACSHNQFGLKSRCASTPQSPLVSLGASACTPQRKCQQCQGDCDKDSDCATGLKCFQRNDRTPVPGCRNGMSGDKPGWDYCYKKEEKVKRPTTNHISGGLPQCVGDLVNLETLDLSVGFHKPTGISGSIPKSICKLKKLTRLDLAHTKVSGSLPECMGSLKIKVLDLQGTLISGPVPTLWCHHASQFSFIFLPKTMCLPKACSHNQFGLKSRCASTPQSPLVSLGASACTPQHKCQQCQGDCDKDSDCATGLKCFQRTDRTPVPGCRNGGSGDKAAWDYCYKKSSPPPLVSGGVQACTPQRKCQQCHGDCDKDSDCATGLKCFQRNDRTPVPGCHNGGSGDKFGWDYCYKSNYLWNIFRKKPSIVVVHGRKLRSNSFPTQHGDEG